VSAYDPNYAIDMPNTSPTFSSSTISHADLRMLLVAHTMCMLPNLVGGLMPVLFVGAATPATNTKIRRYIDTKICCLHLMLTCACC
jgi:hypothetical protein